MIIADAYKSLMTHLQDFDKKGGGLGLENMAFDIAGALAGEGTTNAKLAAAGKQMIQQKSLSNVMEKVQDPAQRNKITKEDLSMLTPEMQMQVLQAAMGLTQTETQKAGVENKLAMDKEGIAVDREKLEVDRGQLKAYEDQVSKMESPTERRQREESVATLGILGDIATNHKYIIDPENGFLIDTVSGNTTRYTTPMQDEEGGLTPYQKTQTWFKVYNTIKQDAMQSMPRPDKIEKDEDGNLLPVWNSPELRKKYEQMRDDAVRREQRNGTLPSVWFGVTLDNNPSGSEASASKDTSSSSRPKFDYTK